MAVKPIVIKIYSQPKSKTIYRQYDSRWGSLKYPYKDYTISRCGCGCVSVTHCALENPKYRNITPKDVRKFMIKYAKAGKGTLQDGIPKGLEHYGYSNIKEYKIKDKDDLSKVWEAFKDGKKGVLLFRGVEKDKSNTTKDGTVWTLKGHYISVVGFKTIGNKHYFYTKDSGKGLDKWRCFETSMKGSLYKAWLGTPPSTK